MHLLRYFVDNVHSPTHRPWSLQRFQQLLSRFCSVGFLDLGLVGMLWCEGRTKDTDQDLYSPKSQTQQNTLFASDLVSSCHWSRDNWWWYHTTARDTRPMPGETVQNILCPNLFFSFGFGSSFCLLLLLASSNALHVALRIQVIPKKRCSSLHHVVSIIATQSKAKSLSHMEWNNESQRSQGLCQAGSRHI